MEGQDYDIEEQAGNGNLRVYLDFGGSQTNGKSKIFGRLGLPYDKCDI